MRAKRVTKQKTRSRATPGSSRARRDQGAVSDDRALLAAAQKVVDRLRTDLRRVVDLLPHQSRSMLGMARHLGIDRNLCQRVLLVAKSPGPGPELLEKSPGIAGLRAFTRSLSGRGPNKESITSLEQAISEFDALIARSGRSQASLARRIRAAQRSESSPQSGDSVFDRPLRESMFRNAADWCGESTDCTIHIFIANRSSDGPQMIDVAMINALIGYTARPPAPPLTIIADASGSDSFETIKRRPLLARGAQTVLWPFTTRPLGVVTNTTSRGGQGGEGGGGLLTVIDPSTVSQGRKVDYVTGVRPVSSAPNTLLVPPYDHDNTIRIRRPARHLLMDVFMHRDVITRVRPGVGTFFPGLQWPLPREQWWNHRLPQHAGLELVGANLGPIRTEAYARHEELVHSAFESLGWPLADFLGHRLSVPFPVWGTDYRIWFDVDALARTRPEEK